MGSNILSSDSLNKCPENKTIERATILWMIENFSNLEEKILKSPTVNSPMNDKIKWHLSLYPNGNGDENKDCLSLYLYLNELNCSSVTSMFTLSILNNEGKKENIKTVDLYKYDKENNYGWGYPQFVKREVLFQENGKLLPNDKLTLFCEVFYFCDKIIDLVSMPSIKLDEPLGLFYNDISSLLESSKFSDCVIKVKDCEIKVHKCILASRSKAFDSILNSENNNSSSNIITINDYSLEVVKEMVNYLYTEKLPNIKIFAIEMLKIGEEFKLEKIKLEAENCLLNSLSFDNVCDYLELSELYNAGTLKEWCIRFIYQNIKTVIKNEKWMEIVKKYPLIIAKLFYISVNIED